MKFDLGTHQGYYLTEECAGCPIDCSTQFLSIHPWRAFAAGNIIMLLTVGAHVDDMS